MKSSMRLAVGLVGLLVVVGAGLALWYDRLFEQVEVPRNTAPQAAARRNPFLALERTYAQLGMPAVSVHGLDRLPPLDTMLMVLTEDRFFDDRAVDQTLSWVEQGGHLLVSYGDDSLSKRLPLRSVPAPLASSSGDEAPATYASDRPHSPRLQAGLQGGPVVRFDGPRDAAWTLTVLYGDGHITGINGSAFLTNTQLGQHDHALLAWDLVNFDSEIAGVWLVVSDRPASVLGLLAREGRPLLVSLLALVGASVWLVSRRFGPLLAAEPPHPRDIVEHIEATGRFLWRTGNRQVLLNATREALLDRIGGPGAAAASGFAPSRDDLARRHPALDHPTIRTALDGPVATTGDGFVEQMRTLEELRRS